MKLLFLLTNFFTIGLFSVGGGYAILPFLMDMADRSVASGSPWLTREMIGNMLAVAQSMPGPVGANLAAYTGFSYAWIPGAFVAAFSLAAPSIVIIMIVAKTLQAFKESAAVKSLFAGLKPAAAGLLSAAAFGAIKLSLWNSAAAEWINYIRWKETAILIAIFILIYKFKKHPIIYIAAAGVIGVILQL